MNRTQGIAVSAAVTKDHRPRLAAFCLACAGLLGLALTSTASARVLRVGSYHGIPGDYTDVQAAVDAAQPGDFILIGPGDWHPQGNGGRAGVYITTPNLTLRGMDRNATVIDGTLPGGDVPCSADPALQNFGPLDANGQPTGRNGVWVYQVSGVEVQNLTVCNFLTGSAGETGNQVFFDGDASHTEIVLHAWCAEYVSTTTSYFDPDHRGEYGLFAWHSDGPGMFEHTYASNMADSGYYIGACPDCNAVIDDAHAQYNALGYSGTNSGGNLVIQNSEWDHNTTGLVTNTQSVGDPPPPQDGACPNGGTGPTGTGSCWILRNNYIHDNNNANVAHVGFTREAPVGTGVVVAGGRNDIIANNLITNNGAWGVLLTIFPDQPEPAGGTPAPPAGEPKQPDCGAGTNIPGEFCLFNAFGNEVAFNTFWNNGFFGNETNGDLAELTNFNDPGNCWHFNLDLSGTVTSAPLLLQTTHAVCGQPNSGDPLTSDLGIQVACNTGALFDCPPNALANYPQAATVALQPLPQQTTMPDPCAGVPANPWCTPQGDTTPRATPAASSGGGGDFDAINLLALSTLLALRRRRAAQRRR